MKSEVNLAHLPAPKVVEPLNYETILEEMCADLKGCAPQFGALIESDPAYKILEVAAYRELLLRQRVNDAARSVMLAHATGSDLDNLAALFGVERREIPTGIEDETQSENDDLLRERIPMSLEGYSTAGPKGAYVYQTIAADSRVKDVYVSSPTAGVVQVVVLSHIGNGISSSDLIDTVFERLNREEVRPLTDKVEVISADVETYEVNAVLKVAPGLDEKTVKEKALTQLNAYVSEQHQLGQEITLSGLYAELHSEEVQKVTLLSPTDDLVVAPSNAPYCTKATIATEVSDDDI